MIKNNLYVYGEDDAQIPAHAHFGLHMLQRCIRHGDAIALLDADKGTSMTFREVAQMTVNVALSLTRLGVKRGDVVSICSENTIEYMPTLFGIACTGATFLPVGIKFIKDRLDVVKPKVVFCSPYAYSVKKEMLSSAQYIKHVILFGEVPEDRPETISFKNFLIQRAPVEKFHAMPVQGWSDVAIVLFSSGTTGTPKAVPLTHCNFILCFQNGVVESIYRAKMSLSTREWCYAYGLMHTLGFLHAGATIVFTENNTAENFLQTIDKYKINIIQLLPTTINDILKSPFISNYDVSSVEYMMSTSIPIDGELSEAAKKRFPNMIGVSQLYGMSEGGCLIIDMGATKGIKPGSVGVPCPGTVFKVVDIVTRKAVGPNQRGEICFKSLTLMSGYIGESGTPQLDEEGFFKTGDIGYYDEDRYFYIVDRVKDMIKYCGYTICPAEIESVLLMHPGVYEVGVSSLPHPDLYEVPLAFVVAQPEAAVTEEELRDYVANNMPSVALVGGVRFVTKLPRGANSKLDRNALRQML